MKQLSIYCSHDLEDRVVHALDAAGVAGYYRSGGSTGNKFLPPGEHPRTVTWDMTLFVVPGASEEHVESVTAALTKYAGMCDYEPCLRIVVSHVEAIVG